MDKLLCPLVIVTYHSFAIVGPVLTAVLYSLRDLFQPYRYAWYLTKSYYIPIMTLFCLALPVFYYDLDEAFETRAVADPAKLQH